MIPLVPQYSPLRAVRALRALVKNPDDLPQVFTLIEALSGTAPTRLWLGFWSTESGRRLLKERPDIVPLLSDKARLRALPKGTLGQVYLEFMESEGLSAEGIRDASDKGSARHDDFYIRQRMRDTHDLWHAAVGYKGDVVGELALLAFYLGQHFNAGMAAIVTAGMLKGFAAGSDLHVVRDGFARGRRAAWLPSVEWEKLLELPIEQVRAQLKLDAPPDYTPVRSNDLRAAGVVG